MQASCDLCCARLGGLLGLRRELVLGDVPADGFLVLFSETAGIDAISDQIYWPAGLTHLQVPVCDCCMWLRRVQHKELEGTEQAALPVSRS